MKTVVLGVTGSIAAYKACDIASRLGKHGVEVHAILTDAAVRFITPLALESITHTPVVTDMFNRETPYEVEHIALAKKADLFLIAPASANFLAKAAHGIADDMLTTTILATKAPILVAPAMNSNMYVNPVVQENISCLKERDYDFVEPATGVLACGDEGIGRLADVDDIVAAAMKRLFPRRDLAGKSILVSAGPTRENIDPVRYITNRSSGKMGFAIAAAAAERGAIVTLVTGPVSLPAPAGVTRVDITTSAELCEALQHHFPDCDALLMAAAPADFTPIETATQKIKKNDRQSMVLQLQATTDILASLAPTKGAKRVLGFAAETENLRENALQKLQKKGLDMIAANDITASGAGFGVDTNTVSLYRPDGTVLQSGSMTKRALGHWLLDQLMAE